MSSITKQSKIINLFIAVLLITCKIVEIRSASLPAKAPNRDMKITTEGLDALKTAVKSTTESPGDNKEPATESGKSTTEGPFANKESKMEPNDDLELKLMDIFQVNSNPKPTSGPQNLEKFSSAEIEAGQDGTVLSLDRRTSFQTVWNCPCVINKRCAESKSCLRKPPSGPW